MSGSTLFRIAAGCFALSLAAGGSEVLRLAASQPAPSLLLILAQPVCALGALLALAACLAPPRILDPWLARVRALPSPEAAAGVGGVALALVAAGVLFLGGAVVWMNSGKDPHLDDQQAYIELARMIRREGGGVLLFVQLPKGRFNDANRHPLYPMLLSANPTEEHGRRLSLIVGLAAIAVFTWLTARAFSWATAAVFALLLAVNRSWLEYSTSVVCESLLTLLIGLAWFALLPPARSSGECVSIRRILSAAALLSLAYLTKATGLMYFGLFLGWLAWELFPRRFEPDVDPEPSLLPRDAPARGRRMALVLLSCVMAFAAVSYPLIARNVVRFGNPFHNVNSLLLFADRYEDLDDMLAQQMSTGDAARSFVRRHGVGDMLEREFSGLGWQAYIMLRALGPWGIDDSRILFGLPLAACALVSLLQDPRRANRLLVVWLLGGWIVFAWYVPIAAGDRFVIPLLPAVLAHAANGLVLLQRLVSDGKSRRRSSAAA
ncbi:MAG: phospholipid carrier-dependent glycosyltransferase [Planctomyces sp.]|nr:phospholipid carrier-dependent glycosyltransferase [Planctomyces sp.]